MSKKRKTRSQKEKAALRHEHQIDQVKRVEEKTPALISYSIEDVRTRTKEKVVAKEPQKNSSSFNYLHRDIKTISVATGLILAFDILLFTLLSTGVLKLGFLGY